METLLMAMHSDIEIRVELAVAGEGGCENINVDESTMASHVQTTLLFMELAMDYATMLQP
jgi:hypothetical protein